MLGRPLAEPKSTRLWSEVVDEMMRRHRAQAGPRWHLVQCVARDQYAREWVTRRGYETYYPQLRSMRPLPRKRLSHAQRKAHVPIMRQVFEPLLPRYQFVRFDPLDGRWRSVFDFAGVAGVACEGDRPIPIADALIEAMRAGEVDGAIPGNIPALDVFPLGAVMRVVDSESPWHDLSGAIERVWTRTVDGVDVADRLTITLHLFGRLTPVEVTPDQVEAQ